MIRHLIFDLDGVLFDGCDFHARLFLEAVAAIRPDLQLTKEFHDAKLHALSTRKKLEVLRIPKEDADRISARKQEQTLKALQGNVHPHPKNLEICRTLVSQGYRLYCVTNSVRETVDLILKGMEIRPFFTGVISNQDTTEPKPSSQPYRTLFERFGLDPQECLIFEDSPHGLESAFASGGHVCPVINCDDLTLEKIWTAIQNIKA